MNNKISIQELFAFLDEHKVAYKIGSSYMPDEKIRFRLASLRHIIPNGIYYIAGSGAEDVTRIRESVIFTGSGSFTPGNNLIIQVSNPQLIHYRLAQITQSAAEPLVHATAIIHPRAVIAKSAHIGPYCVLGECVIGDNVVLQNSITINDNCRIGANTIIESNTVVGARGMAWIWDDDGTRVMQPQSGGVIIEEDCIIGTGIAIVRGSLTENTIIGKGTVMAHGSKVGHGCIVGAMVHFANNVSLAGNAVIGDRVFLGSGCVVSSNVRIGEGCIVGAGAVVHKSIDETYCTVAGVPAAIIRRNNFENKPKGAPKPFRNKNKDEE